MSTAFDQGAIPQVEVRHRLRIARECAGLEQRDLAAIIGVSRNTVGNIEKGKTGIRKIVLNSWCVATGIPVTWALTGEAPAPDGGGDGGGAAEPSSGLRIIRTDRRPVPAGRLLVFPEPAPATRRKVG